MARQWEKLSPAEFQQLQDLAAYSSRKLQDVLLEFCAATTPGDVPKYQPDGFSGNKVHEISWQDFREIKHYVKKEGKKRKDRVKDVRLLGRSKGFFSYEPCGREKKDINNWTYSLPHGQRHRRRCRRIRNRRERKREKGGQRRLAAI
ncbi:unnamed protein product [Trichogramma brassicae]|uniref:Diacylglycerol kinase type I N-terminal domain-containing protein n=1 Tax=Trichogramma brassicae TaxID=86971 RepID=A0A6H5IER0_9HYME|nr:unnamed protein product [Trichogramma brassicae]